MKVRVGELVEERWEWIAIGGDAWKKMDIALVNEEY